MPPDQKLKQPPPLQAYRPSAGQRASVYSLALAFAAIVVLGAVPAGYDLVDHFRHPDDSAGIPTWIYMLLGASLWQFAFVAYLLQVPDYSSTRIAAIVMLLVAALYAMLLGVTLLGGAESWLVARLELPRPQRAAAWCLMMLSLTALLAYFTGRYASRWRTLVTTACLRSRN